jgi:hypothetical protein
MKLLPGKCKRCYATIITMFFSCSLGVLKETVNIHNIENFLIRELYEGQVYQPTADLMPTCAKVKVDNLPV